MIVIGTASGLNLAPVASVAALVSLVTLANSAVALPGKLHHIDWRAVGAATPRPACPRWSWACCCSTI